MKTCLGSLLLVPTLLALLGSAVYHVSVNSELCFEERDTNTEYININRSYRPQVKSTKPEKDRRGSSAQQQQSADREEQP